MGFLQAFKATLEWPGTPLYGDEGWTDDGAFGGPTPSGERVSRERALKLSPWWRAVNLLSADVAKMPLIVRQRVKVAAGLGKKDATKHPAYFLLRRKPNPLMTAFQWKRLMVAQALTTGNAYSFIQRRGDGSPLGLYPVPPGTVTPVLEDAKTLWYVVETPTEGTRRYDSSQVFHIRGFNDDGLVGYNIVQKAAEILGVGLAQRKHQAVFFKNGAKPGVILETPATIPDPVRKKIKEEWDQMHTGSDAAHRTAILDRGLKANRITFSAADAQLIEQMQFTILDIANFTGVPAHKLGHTARQSYSSLEQENMFYLAEGLEQWCIAVEEEAWDKLLTTDQQQDDSHLIEFDRKTLLRVDSNTRASYFKTALGGQPWMVQNEVRDEEGLDPVEGGDDFKTPPGAPAEPADPGAPKEPPVLPPGKQPPKNTGPGAYSPDQERGPDGKFGSGGGGSKGKGRDPAANRPTKPHERHDVTPPSKPMRAPPPPQGTGKGKAGGFTATGHTNTSLGDLAEKAVEKLGLRSILPEGQRQNPLDAEYDHSGIAFEIKAVTTAAKEYKAKPKAAEMESKRAYAEKHGLKPATMIAVVDTEKNKVHAYWREGIGAFSLTSTNLDKWNYAGTVSLKGKK